MTPNRDVPSHILIAGHLWQAIAVVAVVLITFAGSLGLVVLVWRWMLAIVRGGCA
jgi:hypothetical protein